MTVLGDTVHRKFLTITDFGVGTQECLETAGFRGIGVFARLDSLSALPSVESSALSKSLISKMLRQ